MTSAIVQGDSSSVFEALADPAVRLAIWTRPNPCQMDAFPCYASPEPDELSCLPDWLGADIALLGGLYGALLRTGWRVRLETATTRTCPAFHEDAVRLRLLVTYRGAGSEWTAEPETGRIERVPTGAVAALKGRAWPSDQRILHRSSKASRRSPRWVLAMDSAALE